MAGQHFIAKITKGGGPRPSMELDKIIEQAEGSEDCDAWFGTRKSGQGWRHRQGMKSVCIILAADGDSANGINAVVAEIKEKTASMPDTPVVRELYQGHEDFPGWWRLRNPIRVVFPTLKDVPGVSGTSLRADKTFGNTSASFAYWQFTGQDIDSLLAGNVLSQPQQPDRGPVSSGTTRHTPCPDNSQVPLDPQLVTDIARTGAPYEDLFGVDFSGGKETGTGNPKIWIAAWPAREGRVTLIQGSEVGLCRRDLPRRIQGSPGWWVLDFPFGVAKDTAAAIGLDPNRWEDWLHWCAQGNDPTERRNLARTLVEQAGVPWASRRQIDVDNQTTWFPLFEQLYRQTITGAAEVLWPLARQTRDQVAILPWHDRAGAPTVVCEGFPGVTISRRLGMPANGYKGVTDLHRRRRLEILGRLRECGIPLDDAQVARGVADTEGDAVDALVLLLAARISQSLETREWVGCRERLRTANRLFEGWFPA